MNADISLCVQTYFDSFVYIPPPPQFASTVLDSRRYFRFNPKIPNIPLNESDTQKLYQLQVNPPPIPF
jgi:hypothetical protein